MENSVEHFLASLYVAHVHILGEELSDVFKSSILNLHHQT